MSTSDFARSYANHPANFGPQGSHFQKWEAELRGTTFDQHVADADKLIKSFPPIAPRIERAPKPASSYHKTLFTVFAISALVGIVATAVYIGLGGGKF